MNDTERAVNECRRAIVEGSEEDGFERLDQAIEAVRREAVDILKDAHKHMVGDPAFINDQGDRDMLRRVEDYIRQHE